MKKLFAHLIVFQLFSVVSYTQNLRTFADNGKFGYKNGNTIVIPARFDYAADFNDSFAAVLVSGKWGFIRSNGDFLVQPKYKKVESFQKGFARFYEGKKFGLINNKGEQVVNAVCDDVSFNEKTCRLESNGKLSWASLASNKIAGEFKYTSISFGYHFVDCSNGITHDLYTVDGDLIASNCRQGELLRNSYSTILLDVCRDGKEYLVDTTGKAITEEFYKINLERSTYYRPNPDGYGYYNLICCYLNEETDEMKLIRPDGYVYKGVYTNWLFDENKTTVEQGGSTYQLSVYGELIEQDYRKVRSVFGVLLLTGDTNAEYVAIESGMSNTPEFYTSDTLILDTFTSVRELYVPYYDPDYYDGDGWNNDVANNGTLNSLGLVEVEGTGVNAGKFALYDCFKRRLITEFDEYHKEIRPEYCTDDVVAFSNEKGHLGALVAGKTFTYMYTSIERFGWDHYVLRDTLGHETFVSAHKQKFCPIPANCLVQKSTVYPSVEPTLYFDEVTGEEYYAEQEQRLYQEFVFLVENRDNPRVGFVDGLAQVVLPVFDSITEDMNFIVQEAPERLIFVWKDGKCGVYNLDFGWVSQPMFDSIPTFNYDSYNNIIYAEIPGSTNYLSSHGRWFAGTSFEPSVFKKNGMYGLQDYLPLIAMEEPEVVIEPTYKMLNLSYEQFPLLEVQNKLGENSVLSMQTLDTLIPFTKNKLSLLSDYASDDVLKVYYEVKAKKFKGLYDIIGQHAIPPIYDEIILPNAGAIDDDLFYVYKEGKAGLYNRDLKLMLECEYDGITVRSFADYRFILAQKGNKVEVYNYMYGDKLIMPIEVSEFDFVIEGIGYNKFEGGYRAFNIGEYKYLGETKAFQFEDESIAENFEVTEENGLLTLKDISQNKKLVSGIRLLSFVEGEYMVVFDDARTYYQSMYNKKSRYSPKQW